MIRQSENLIIQKGHSPAYVISLILRVYRKDLSVADMFFSSSLITCLNTTTRLNWIWPPIQFYQTSHIEDNFIQVVRAIKNLLFMGEVCLPKTLGSILYLSQIRFCLENKTFETWLAWQCHSCCIVKLYAYCLAFWAKKNLSSWWLYVTKSVMLGPLYSRSPQAANSFVAERAESASWPPSVRTNHPRSLGWRSGYGGLGIACWCILYPLYPLLYCCIGCWSETNCG